MTTTKTDTADGNDQKGRAEAIARRDEIKKKWAAAAAKLAVADEQKEIAKFVKALQNGALNLKNPITIRKFSKKH